LLAALRLLPLRLRPTVRSHAARGRSVTQEKAVAGHCGLLQLPEVPCHLQG
jgi:hypothetical protein